MDKINEFLKELKEEVLKKGNDLFKYAIIRKKGKKYVLYDSKGKKVLGVHDTYEKASRQEKAIQIAKKRRKFRK